MALSDRATRYDLYYDMGTVIAMGLYKEVKTRAGPEVMKQVQAKVPRGRRAQGGLEGCQRRATGQSGVAKQLRPL